MSARNVNLVVDQGVDFGLLAIQSNNNSRNGCSFRIQNQKTSNSDKISWIYVVSFPDRINGVIKVVMLVPLTECSNGVVDIFYDLVLTSPTLIKLDLSKEMF